MADKKYPKRISHRALLHGVQTVDGWVLLSRDDDSKEWHIAWLEIFSRKAEALKFAGDNQWHPPFKAVRGSLAVIIPAPKRR